MLLQFGYVSGFLIRSRSALWKNEHAQTHIKIPKTSQNFATSMNHSYSELPHLLRVLQMRPAYYIIMSQNCSNCEKPLLPFHSPRFCSFCCTALQTLFWLCGPRLIHVSGHLLHIQDVGNSLPTPWTPVQQEDKGKLNKKIHAPTCTQGCCSSNRFHARLLWSCICTGRYSCK